MQISPYGRDDTAALGIWEKCGGCATTFFPLYFKCAVIPIETKWSEESYYFLFSLLTSTPINLIETKWSEESYYFLFSLLTSTPIILIETKWSEESIYFLFSLHTSTPIILIEVEWGIFFVSYFNLFFLIQTQLLTTRRHLKQWKA